MQIYPTSRKQKEEISKLLINHLNKDGSYVSWKAFDRSISNRQFNIRVQNELFWYECKCTGYEKAPFWTLESSKLNILFSLSSLPIEMQLY